GAALHAKASAARKARTSRRWLLCMMMDRLETGSDLLQGLTGTPLRGSMTVPMTAESVNEVGLRPLPRHSRRTFDALRGYHTDPLGARRRQAGKSGSRACR